MRVLINALGIQDSGGITILEKLIDECILELKNSYVIICNQNTNINSLKLKYNNKNLIFKDIESTGFLHRLYFENISFKKIIQDENIDLVYNFSGTAQLISKVPQLTKVQNLLFYSKKLNSIYLKEKKYLSWLKEVFFKMVVFRFMLKQTKFIEIQSSHVRDYISDFLSLEGKNIYIKSDINISSKIFLKPKEYDFDKKIKFLFIVGPHFKYIHKNLNDFSDFMMELTKLNIDFEINITLTEEELTNSSLWNNTLKDKTNFLGYLSKEEIKYLFKDNTILVSTSIIETLGLHVIESIQNGILVIAPNERYSCSVYGNDILTYKLFDINSLKILLKSIVSMSNNNIKDIILKNQEYLINNEKKKYNSIVNIFEEVLKDKNV